MGSKAQIPRSQFLLSWFLSFIMGLSINRRLFMVYTMTISQAQRYTYTYLFMHIIVCKFFLQVDYDSRKGLLQNHSLQRTPMIPFAEKVPLSSPHMGLNQ